VFVAPRSAERRRPGLVRLASVSESPLREVTPQSSPPTLRPTRLGVTVTRKVGRAHQRNRIKRLVREVFRQERSRLPTGYDMVWVAKRNALGATLEELRNDFTQLARRLSRDAERGSP
jgi:ribonuclease P protein component